MTQEWMINFNALMISIFTFLMGYFTRKIPTLVTIIMGIVMAIIATYCLGLSMGGWFILGCIGLFSLGEMMSGPGFSKYIVDIAPEGKAGLYIGFSGFTVGIGWSIGSIIAGHLYEKGGDKVVLARRYLVEQFNMNSDQVAAIAKEKVVPKLAELAGTDAFGVRDRLWSTCDPYSMWAIFAAIGVGALLMLIVYNRAVGQRTKTQASLQEGLRPIADHDPTTVSDSLLISSALTRFCTRSSLPRATLLTQR